MQTRAVKIPKVHMHAPRSQRAFCWDHSPFTIPTHHQLGRVGHNSDRSIAHNHCSSAFFFLSRWYRVWLFGTWKCRHGTWQSLQVLLIWSKEHICSTLLCKFTADLPTSLDPRPFWQGDKCTYQCYALLLPYGEDDGDYMGQGLTEEGSPVVGNLITHLPPSLRGYC